MAIHNNNSCYYFSPNSTYEHLLFLLAKNYKGLTAPQGLNKINHRTTTKTWWTYFYKTASVDYTKTNRTANAGISRTTTRNANQYGIAVTRAGKAEDGRI